MGEFDKKKLSFILDMEPAQQVEVPKL